MSKFSQRLKELRSNRSISQQRFADDIGTSKSSINMYERGEREPGIVTLEKIADYFNVDLDYLLGKSEIPNKALSLSQSRSELSKFDNVYPVTLKRFPLLGDIACGKPIFADESRESYLMSGADINADFCLRCKGDSMIGARIYDGDIVFIHKQDMVENGEIAAVVIGEEATLKRVMYYPAKNMLILKAENSKYEDLVFTDTELEEIHILGRAVAFQSDVR